MSPKERSYQDPGPQIDCAFEDYFSYFSTKSSVVVLKRTVSMRQRF